MFLVGDSDVFAVNVLENDFKTSLEKIDFSKAYDPFSKSFMKALFLGQLWTCVKCLCDDVEDELNGAKNYYDIYLETNDAQYKEMASDELKHAGILIKKHLTKATDEKQKEKLNELEAKRQEMLKEFAQSSTKTNAIS